VASLSQGRTAAAQCGLFTHKSVPVIFEPPCSSSSLWDNHHRNKQLPSDLFSQWIVKLPCFICNTASFF